MHAGKFTREERELLGRALLWALDSTPFHAADPEALRVWVCGALLTIARLERDDSSRLQELLFGAAATPPRSDG